MLEEKEEEGMGVATIRYGETNAFIRHVERDVWLTYQTSEVTKKGIGMFTIINLKFFRKSRRKKSNNT